MLKRLIFGRFAALCSLAGGTLVIAILDIPIMESSPERPGRRLAIHTRASRESSSHSAAERSGSRQEAPSGSEDSIRPGRRARAALRAQQGVSQRGDRSASPLKRSGRAGAKDQKSLTRSRSRMKKSMLENETASMASGYNTPVDNVKSSASLFGFDVDEFCRRRGFDETLLPTDRPPTREDLDRAKVKPFTYGTVIGYRTLNGIVTTTLAMRFTPWEEISANPALERKVVHFANWLHRVGESMPQVKTNSSWINGGQRGEMYAIGWRKSYEQAGQSIGLYTARNSATWKDPGVAKAREAKIQQWANINTEAKDIAEFFAERYGSLAPKCAEESYKYVKEAKVPSFGATERFNAFNGQGFGSNLTATRKDFANALHLDNDGSPYTFGMWLLTDSDGNPVTEKETTRTAVNGGEFVYATQGVAADFGGCNGMVELLWRGKDDLHGTCLSETSQGYERWGTSVQVAGKLELHMASKDIDQELVKDLTHRLSEWHFTAPDHPPSFDTAPSDPSPNLN